MTFDTAEDDKGRKGGYLCSKCGQPKRGHVCTAEKKENSKALRSTAKSDPLNLYEEPESSDSDNDDDLDDINPDILEERAKQLTLNASLYNSQIMLERRNKNPFYYDPHTNSTQVIGSWIVNLVVTPDWIEKQQALQLESKRREMLTSAKTLSDKELKINLTIPKAPISAFMHFSREIRLTMKDNAQSANIVEASKAAGQIWREMKDKDKKKYEDMSEADRARYKREMAEYSEKIKQARESQLKLLSTFTADQIVDRSGNIDIKIALLKLPEITQFELKPGSLNKDGTLRSPGDKSGETKEVNRCAWCKRTKEKDLLACSVCTQYYHFRCLELPDETLEKIKLYDITKWKCPDCKDCTICKTAGQDNDLLLCDVCDRGFHIFCLKPPLEKPPEGRWVCTDCVACKSCGSKVPGPSQTDKWHRGYSLCSPCYQLFEAKQYCPVCEKVYADVNSEPMTQCTRCSLHVHNSCDKVYTEGMNDFVKSQYKCPSCIKELKKLERSEKSKLKRQKNKEWEKKRMRELTGAGGSDKKKKTSKSKKKEEKEEEDDEEENREEDNSRENSEEEQEEEEEAPKKSSKSRKRQTKKKGRSRGKGKQKVKEEEEEEENKEESEEEEPQEEQEEEEEKEEQEEDEQEEEEEEKKPQRRGSAKKRKQKRKSPASSKKKKQKEEMESENEEEQEEEEDANSNQSSEEEEERPKSRRRTSSPNNKRREDSEEEENSSNEEEEEKPKKASKQKRKRTSSPNKRRKQ